MSIHIAVDAGGTQLRAAICPSDGASPPQISRIPTQDGDSTPLERLYQLLDSVWPVAEPVAAIAVAVPGPTDPYAGIIFTAPNIPGWDDLPLQRLLEERYRVPVAIGNDANLAALGEWKFGAGRGHHHLVYLTVSTGIGGGVICDDRLLLGYHGLAAELGHVTVLADGPVCGCGARGHLEAVSSGTGIANWVREQITSGVPTALANIQPITAKVVFQAAQAGDPLAHQAFTRAGRYLGIGVANYLHIFNPSAIVFGGGVSRSGELLFAPMRLAMQEVIMTPHYLDGLTITTAELGDEAGLMGALALAKELHPG